MSFFLVLTIFLSVICCHLVYSRSLIQVTCIGDSITSGGGCLTESYVDVLAEKLGTRYSVLNAGVSGSTMMKQGKLHADDVTTYSYWDTDAWKQALQSQPHIVTVMLGTNDAKWFNWNDIQQNIGDFYALDYVDMIHQLRRQTSVKDLFVMIPPPAMLPLQFSINQTIVNEILPTLVRNIAQVNDVKVIDLFTPMSTGNYTCDAIHPTHEGNVIIANTIYENIMKYASSIHEV